MCTKRSIFSAMLGGAQCPQSVEFYSVSLRLL